MLCGVFRTKEGKVISVLLVLTVMIIGGFIFKNYSANRQYEEQAVVAEKYLQESNYEQAVSAYIKALSMKNSDRELLSIGLAESYIGVNDYDKALEILRSCYQDTSGIMIKEKIEEVTSRKMDYDYLQIISRADIYFSNEEYAKAIAEYEKAKLIKSKEMISYQRIALAYIKTGEYNLAKEELQEGLELTQSTELANTLATVGALLLKQQYDTIVADAAEYIYQENYEDGFIKYKEAINLIPQEEQAYKELADTYVTLGLYQEGITLLQNASKNLQSEELKGILDRATQLLTLENERKNTLSDLYAAFTKQDFDKIIDIMNSEAFQKRIAIDAPLYYSPEGEGDISTGSAMVIYDSENIYSGQIKNGRKQDYGIYFMLTKNNGEQGYYYYRGEWSNDIPDGNGKTEEETTTQDENGNNLVSITVTNGIFLNGAENGSMQKSFYIGGIETGSVLYTAQKGIPMPMTEEGGITPPIEEGKPYAIGTLVTDGQTTGEHYLIEPNTYWGVKSFKNK